MVKVRDDKPIREDGSVDLEQWLKQLEALMPCSFAKESIVKAFEFARMADQHAKGQENLWSHRTSSFHTGLEMAIILAELRLDLDSIVAAILYRSVRERKTSIEEVRAEFGNDIAELIDGVLKMAAISELKNSYLKGNVLGQHSDQLENLRKMLVALVDDVRVALIKISERTCAIREVKDADDDRKQKVAREIFEIYAPLAHRLGIGQLKWELEDLSFRYLEPEAYKQIADLLDERRIARQQYIEDVLEELSSRLTTAGIKAEVSGRAKHIYSIWRKMKQKGVGFSEVYDVRAVRVLTQDVTACYTALGIVHGTWSPLPGEFDDYIANPKPNGYKSLHTAVIGPSGKAFEVQVRTYEMHEDAELGICAHWRYKEGEDNSKQNQAYEDKIAWLRQVIDWQEELGEDVLGTIADQFSHAIIDERIYVFTRDGHVVDLPSGATPIDFAYHVHTEIGHTCRGAKINGKMVPLTYPLKTGEQVDIITTKNGGPSRDWLNPNLSYIKTPRARAKAKHWFKRQDRDKNIHDGKFILGREFHRLAITQIDLNRLAPKLNLRSGEDIHAAVGAGDLRVSQVLNAVQRVFNVEVPNLVENKSHQMELTSLPYPNAGPSSINIQGVDNILTQIAKCCKPVPGDDVTGYITMGRGVTIHRNDCSHIQGLIQNDPDRIVDINWNVSKGKVYPVDVKIKAYDRTALLRDITDLLAKEKISLLKVQYHSDDDNNVASVTLTMQLDSLEVLGRVLARISQLKNVFDVQRYDA